MAKRVYKLQEFVAHASNVNCLSIAKKGCRLFVTGGDDHKAILWAIGKPTSLMTLCGHTSSVESLAFDPAEVLVLAGASAGAIKLWDLEEAKLVRSLTGHRSNCTAVEFHPFGEFFASGSMDTNLKIWDIRKKGCIHTYQGHTGGISNIRFTPDGRWIVTGGLDNVVKVWDLTAGKHLHDFKFHGGPIRSIDFHPLEFLLATGSADKTVKFSDLESFELIGSSIPEASGVRAIAFNPDGRTLFCGLEDCLKVYSWEPVICHDTVDVGWSTLVDLCIHEGKLLGCSYYRNSVAVWVADTSLIQPYGSCPVPEGTDRKNVVDEFGISSSDKIKCGTRPFSSVVPCSEMADDIKNIYIDCSGGSPVLNRSTGSLSPSRTDSLLDSKTRNGSLTEMRSTTESDDWKIGHQALSTSFTVPAIVPQDSPQKGLSNSARETIPFSKTKPGMLLRPSNVRKPSNSKNEIEKGTPTHDSVAFHLDTLPSVSEPVKSIIGQENESFDSLQLPSKNMPDCAATEPPKVARASSALETLALLDATSLQDSNESVHSLKGTTSLKIVNGVTVVTGRTRTLVEKFERQEKQSYDDQTQFSPSVPDLIQVSPGESKISSPLLPGMVEAHEKLNGEDLKQIIPSVSDQEKILSAQMEMPSFGLLEIPSNAVSRTHSASEYNRISVLDTSIDSSALPDMGSAPALVSHSFPQSVSSNATKLDTPVSCSSPSYCTNSFSATRNKSSVSTRSVVTPRTSKVAPRHSVSIPSSISRPSLRSSSKPLSRARCSPYSCPPSVAPCTSPIPLNSNNSPDLDSEHSPVDVMNSSITSGFETAFSVISSQEACVHSEMNRQPHTMMNGQAYSNGDVSSSLSDISKSLMQSHDQFLSALKSRLMKLQMVRHFWERRDVRGAVDALRRLPDHSVQADVVSVLMDKMELLNLDLFSLLLPMLVGLLGSKMDRHASLSLEFLLKLVAVFGPVIRSTTSAPPLIGIDLHAEQRRESCIQCQSQLEQVQQILPTLSRRSSVLAKSALELNLVLQES